jgi:hypothetical protein
MGVLDDFLVGALPICQTDVDIAEAGGGEVGFSRTQTQGASCCNFRYRFEPR